MGILRDTLYTDRVLAVLREYGSNAWDAHRETGKGNTPIKVTLPTFNEPTLTIRDFGPGLSEDGIFKVFTQYGRSTKRDSDLAVGMLGIGSKSGFAYSDSFTVLSWHGEMKRTYVAVLDETETGIINRLAEEPCGIETGLEIQIAVRPEDIYDFQHKARGLFRHFEPRPVINIELPPIRADRLKLKHGAITFSEKDNSDGWVAVMGCVPYRVNLKQVAPESGGSFWQTLHQLSGVLYFNIGEVQTSASREELKYSPGTKKALVQKFEDLVEESVKHTLETLTKGTAPLWERRVQAQVVHKFHLPLLDQYKEMLTSHVRLAPTTFHILDGQERQAVSSIRVHALSRFLIRDCEHGLQGYHLASTDYVIRAVEGKDLTAVRAELALLITAAQIDGIPVTDLSTLTWTQTNQTSSGRKINKKHQVRTFRLQNRTAFCSPWSGNWDIETRVPTKDDVFVILQYFMPDGPDGFYHTRETDLTIADALKMTLPPVYGYKSTVDKPVTPKDCLGTPYAEWRVTFFRTLLAKNPRLRTLMGHFRWAQLFDLANRYDNTLPNKVLSQLTAGLGADHPITMLLRTHLDSLAVLQIADKTRNYNGPRLTQTLERLVAITAVRKSEATMALERVYEKYPLLGIHETRLRVLWGCEARKWLDYIKLIDRVA